MKHTRRRVPEKRLLLFLQLDANERETQTCCSFVNFSVMKGVQKRSFGIVPSRWHTASGNCNWNRSLLLPK